MPVRIKAIIAKKTKFNHPKWFLMGIPSFGKLRVKGMRTWIYEDVPEQGQKDQQEE